MLVHINKTQYYYMSQITIASLVSKTDKQYNIISLTQSESSSYIMTLCVS